MRGPSVGSDTAVLDAVVASVGSGADSDRLGTQLFEVAATFDSQVTLRRALTDPAVDGDRKATLVEQLFHAFDERTVALVCDAVRRLWSQPRDLADSVERAGVTALLVAAEDADAIDELEDELFRFTRIVESAPQLREALSDRTAPAQARRRLVEELLGDRVNTSSVRLAQQAVSGRHRSVTEALKQMQRLAAGRRERLVAVVRVAEPLADQLRDRLAAALARMFDHELQLNVVVDPEVLGGVRVTVGDQVVDGTVLSRLAGARRRLVG